MFSTTFHFASFSLKNFFTLPPIFENYYAKNFDFSTQRRLKDLEWSKKFHVKLIRVPSARPKTTFLKFLSHLVFPHQIEKFLNQW